MKRAAIAIAFIFLSIGFIFWADSFYYKKNPVSTKRMEGAVRLVLLYATCSVNKDYLAPYNPGVQYTPNLDSLAKEGITFTKHETEVGFSGPAFATLFTGSWMYQHGIYFHPASLRSDSYMIAEAFRDNSYDTFCWNGHEMASAKLNYAQGVNSENVIRLGFGSTLNARDDRFKSILTRLKSKPKYKAYVQIDSSMTHAPYSGNSNIKTTQAFCEKFPEECKLVSNEDITSYLELYARNHVRLSHHFEDAVASLKLHPEQIGKLSQVLEVTYKSSLHRLDRSFGEIVNAIRRAGLLNQSLLVFTSDHGEILYREDAHVKWGHYGLEPEVLNVPLLIRLPSEPKRSYYKHVTRAIDVFPTVAALSRIKIPPAHRLEGRDLSAAILGKSMPPRLVAFSSFGLSHPAVGNADPKIMPVQARDGDTLYRLFANSKMQMLHVTENPTSVSEPTASDRRNEAVLKELNEYRKRVIGGLKPPVEDSSWAEVREKLKSLGYAN